MKQFIYVVLLCYIGALHAQTPYSISCSVMDRKGDPIQYATLLLKIKDEVIRYEDVLDGLVKMEELSSNHYTLECIAMGYEKFSQTIFLDKNSEVTIVLHEDVTQLDAVTVTFTQNSLEHKNGTTKLNVANSN